MCNAGRHDSSGIRLHYTPSLRQYDAGIMELGLVYTPIMAVPPKQEIFYLSGHCTSKCTQTVCIQNLYHLLPYTVCGLNVKNTRQTCLQSAAYFKFFVFLAQRSWLHSDLKETSFPLSALLIQALPTGGIYIFASQLHTHLAGRGVRTVLVRRGKELEVVQEDQHFSTHYQVRARFTHRNPVQGISCCVSYYMR